MSKVASPYKCRAGKEVKEMSKKKNKQINYDKAQNICLILMIVINFMITMLLIVKIVLAAKGIT